MTGIQRRWLHSVIAILVALVVSVVFLFSLGVGLYYYNGVSSSLEAKAKTTTDFFANYISQSYNDFFESCIDFAQSFDDNDVLELQFISVNGKLLASSYGPWTGQITMTQDVRDAISGRKIASFNGLNPGTNERIMAVSSPMIYTNGEVIGVLRYVTSLRLVHYQIAMIALIAVLCGAVFIFVVLLSSWYFLRSIVEPVTEITETAKRISAGSYGAQIKRKFDDEIGELADTINDMSVKISQTEKTQTEFISSVSHELRTPLTAISGWTETLIASEGADPETERRGLDIILRESRRLTGMVEELLEFTRMQDGRFKLNVELCDIRSEYEDAIFMYGSRLKQEGIRLEYLENDDDIPEIPCDASRIRQVLLNLLDNAAKHGGEGRRIDTAICREKKDVCITVRDYGPGIPPEELPHVKRKFYKGSSKARGSGIGLAVCEEIMTMHGGSLELKNADGGGLLVTVRIPIGEE